MRRQRRREGESDRNFSDVGIGERAGCQSVIGQETFLNTGSWTLAVNGAAGITQAHWVMTHVHLPSEAGQRGSVWTISRSNRAQWIE